MRYCPAMLRLLATFLLILPGVGCDDQPTPDPAGPTPLALVEGAWPGAILAAAPLGGSTADPAMLFAGGAPDRGFVLRAKAGLLTSMQVPTGPALWWLATLDDGQAWAAGDGGRILRLAGDRWVPEQTELGEKAVIWGVFAVSATDLWAVGGSYRRGGPKGLVLRSAGDGVWRRVEDPALPETSNLYKVWGAAADAIYIVGELGVTLRWDGRRFTREDIPETRLLFSVHGSEDGELFAVGGLEEGRIFRRSAGQWVEESVGAVPVLTGIFSMGGGRAIATGARGTILDRDTAGVWTRRPIDPSLARHGLHAVVVQDNTTWAVGGDLLQLSWGALATDTEARPVWMPDE